MFEMDSSIRDPNTYAIIGAAMSVHTELGCGFEYHVDFICRGVIVEVKALDRIGTVEVAQVLANIRR